MVKLTLNDLLACVDNAIEYANSEFKILLEGFDPTSKQVNYTSFNGPYDYLDVKKTVNGQESVPVFILSDKNGKSISFIINDYEVVLIGASVRDQVGQVIVDCVSDFLITTLERKNGSEYSDDYASYHYFKDIRSAKNALTFVDDLLLRRGLNETDGEILDLARDVLTKLSQMAGEQKGTTDEQYFNSHREYLQKLKLENFGHDKK